MDTPTMTDAEIDAQEAADQQARADLAQKLIAEHQRATEIREIAKLDDAVQPLLDLLRSQMLIQGSAHVEWQGVEKHGLLPVYWFADDSDASGCLNVYPDGTFDEF